jgi:anthranilate synthase component 1
VSRVTVVPLATVPDLAALGAALPQTYRFLLDSAEPGPLGTYSLLLRHNGESLWLDAAGVVHGDAEEGGFLESLSRWYARECSPHNDPSTELPFSGGWFLYLGYEIAGEVEPVLDLPPATDGLPVALAARCDGAVLVRHGEIDQAMVVAESHELATLMLEELAGLVPEVQSETLNLAELSADPAAEFEHSVARIHDYILAGDVFQVNLSRGWSGRFEESVNPFGMYRRLCSANPAPFAGVMCWDDQVLLSSSPERLVEVRGRQVQTRPIAGTHPRSNDAAADQALARQMLAHPKERAEHIMLIDLERNDLGRVCETGSVEVSELMVVETYAHVHHIVSNVRGRLREDTSPVDVISAVFPGGTITGCPKVRCMQIIAELEGKGRGFYTGSMGYLDRGGDMDLNILIRSMLVRQDSFRFRTGAGIVADSKPEREVSETEHKALGLLKALGADPGTAGRAG